MSANGESENTLSASQRTNTVSSVPDCALSISVYLGEHEISIGRVESYFCAIERSSSEIISFSSVSHRGTKRLDREKKSYTERFLSSTIGSTQYFRDIFAHSLCELLLLPSTKGRKYVLAYLLIFLLLIMYPAKTIFRI